ncbi:MAG: hypothetical protein A2583_12070 [Bdellovibrionales bacterium RIFOXYD1_FULL_53_11]|nr:MAG: hypothetical protein A2583_12070 [Bdellovibrionales bacterium RIFOXYD1_FULL_53_11]
MPSTSRFFSLGFLFYLVFTNAGIAAINRATHPYVPGMFQNLVSLNSPRNYGGERRSALKLVIDDLAPVTAITGNIFLGPVYPQSVLEHIDTEKMKLYQNTGNYWPASFDGVDPRLGTKQEFIGITKRASELGIGVIQDVVFNNIGYLPQNERQDPHYIWQLGQFGVNVPGGVNIREQFYLWGSWVDLHDAAVFHQRGVITTEAYDTYERAEIGSPQYEWALTQVQEGDLYGLRKLRMDQPGIFDRMMNDHAWYIRDAGVTKFRIDAAKHFRGPILKNIINRLRSDVARFRPGAAAEFYLEFWTQNYRNMSFVLGQLAGSTDRVYFFDYALAGAIRDVILHGGSFQHKIGGILGARHINGIKPYMLVPVWMDHDFFIPVYDGSELSLARMAAGYVLAYMMSSNAPHYYNGFEKTNFGHPYDGNPARDPIHELIDTSSRGFLAIKSLVSTLSNPLAHEVLSQSDDVFITSDSKDHVVLERRLDKRDLKVIARISRSSDPGWEYDAHLVWEYLNPRMSVRVFTRGR